MKDKTASIIYLNKGSLETQGALGSTHRGADVEQVLRIALTFIMEIFFVKISIKNGSLQFFIYQNM